MQHTIKYEQQDKTHATHNQTSTKRENPCNTQSNIDKTLEPMQHTTKYQRNDKTNAIHNQISTK